MSDTSPAGPAAGQPAPTVVASNSSHCVWIIDPLPVSREGMRHLIDSRSHLRVVGTSHDARDLIVRSQPSSLNVVLITDKVPGNDAFVAVQMIRQTEPELPIVRLASEINASVNDEQHGITATIKANVDVDTLLATLLRAAASHRVPHHEAPSPQQRSLRRGQLSAREHQVLELLAHGISNKDIARHLSIGDETVKTHVAHILSKLEARDRTHAVAIALRNGIIR